MKTRSGIAFVFVALLAASQAAFAQNNGNGNGNRGRLPNGKPFQMLQAAIADVDTRLQQQIATIQGQIDSQGANLTNLTQMVSSLQAAVKQLELRMATTERTVDDLQDYINAVDASLAFQVQRIDALQQQVNTVQGTQNSQTTQLNNLFAQYNALQTAVNNLKSSVSNLAVWADQVSITNTQQWSAIQNLGSQMAAVNDLYSILNGRLTQVRNALSTGCPSGSSIRSVGFTGQVMCQTDNVSSIGPAESMAFAQRFAVPGNGFGFSIGSYSVSCPPATPAWKATGGGLITNLELRVAGSFQDGNGWTVQVYNPQPFASYDLIVTVTCYRTT